MDCDDDPFAPPGITFVNMDSPTLAPTLAPTVAPTLAPTQSPRLYSNSGLVDQIIKRKQLLGSKLQPFRARVPERCPSPGISAVPQPDTEWPWHVTPPSPGPSECTRAPSPAKTPLNLDDIRARYRLSSQSNGFSEFQSPQTTPPAPGRTIPPGVRTVPKTPPQKAPWYMNSSSQGPKTLNMDAIRAKYGLSPSPTSKGTRECASPLATPSRLPQRVSPSPFRKHCNVDEMRVKYGLSQKAVSQPKPGQWPQFSRDRVSTMISPFGGSEEFIWEDSYTTPDFYTDAHDNYDPGMKVVGSIPPTEPSEEDLQKYMHFTKMAMEDALEYERKTGSTKERYDPRSFPTWVPGKNPGEGPRLVLPGEEDYEPPC